MTTKYNGFWLRLVNVNGCIKARHIIMIQISLKFLTFLIIGSIFGHHLSTDYLKLNSFPFPFKTFYPPPPQCSCPIYSSQYLLAHLERYHFLPAAHTKAFP